VRDEHDRQNLGIGSIQIFTAMQHKWLFSFPWSLYAGFGIFGGFHFPSSSSS